jgi:translation initiation factor 2 subunit 2
MPDPVLHAVVEAAPDFNDGLKKKKKKKVKADDVGDDTPIDDGSELADSLNAMAMADAAAAAGAEGAADAAPHEFAVPAFDSSRKKRKRKPVVFSDAGAADSGGDGLGSSGDRGSERKSRREVAPQPWDGDDREYTYEELLGRALMLLHGKNPSLPGGGGGGGRKKISLQLPQVAREGTKKTVFLNFGSIAKSIHRQQDHLLAYLGAELGTSGNIQDGGRLVIKGRFTAEGIANVLKRYMMDYVICQSCRSPDTVLMRDANTRLYFVSCESCGAHRSVANISAGYVARVTRRKKVG